MGPGEKAGERVGPRDGGGSAQALRPARDHRRARLCAKDSVWQAQFEDAFPYEETPDQLRAIEEVKRDMERPRPMDRLLCGDVGYGKTEVAVRAAFKAVDRREASGGVGADHHPRATARPDL